MAMPGRFLSIFFAAHQLDDSQIGIILASSKLVSLVAGPIVCNIADRLRKRELVTAVTYSIAIIVFVSQAFALPSLQLIPQNMRFSFILGLQILHGIFTSAAYPLVSAITIAQLKSVHGDKGHERFGEERLWGAVSWAICALLLGFLLDFPTLDVWIIHIGVVLFGSIFVASLLIFARANKSSAGIIEEESARTYTEEDSLMEHSNAVEDGTVVEQDNEQITLVSTLRAVYTIMLKGGASALLFFNLMFCLAAGMSLVEGLLFLFFKDDLKSSNLICGISVVITVIFEIPLFAVAPTLLQKLGSPALAVIGSLGYTVRGFGYTMVPNASMVLLFEPLHGITFATFHTASVAYVAERSPRELEATAQSILLALRAFGSASGTVVGGYVMEVFGSRVLYRGAAILVLLATAMFAAQEQRQRQRGVVLERDVVAG